MDMVSRASAEKRRHTLLEILRERPLTSGMRADRPPIAPPSVSRDLRPLRVARLLARHQAHRRTCSLRRPERLADVDAWTDGARAVWQRRLDSLHIEISNGRKTR